VDGKNLGHRVKVALGEAGFDEVLPWYGGDYKVEETVLGEAARRNAAEGAILFACGCGQYACSGVSANVVISGGMLTLRDIFTWRGGQCVFAPIEPITFDRQQFDDAVRRLERQIELWPPARSPAGRDMRGPTNENHPLKRADRGRG